MGRLVYDGAVRFVIDDRTLAHLQVVIGDKLRRREPFTFTWANPLDDGGGRTSVWMSPASSLAFTFDRHRPQRLNRAWLDALSAATHSPAGLSAIPEPEPEDDRP
ncbi:ATP-dependent DNA ligase [Microbacterium sp. T2.11-28]|uniref:DUF7882 family protein n=1 Tax=unclassified Microbacterium TaxID=2609290 RepID=UPI00247741BC|nr:ATP-dependent DNA ligase [Microbacterium sp. T2.11-28]CAI9387046.1 hypothetical protein MICABA_00735 [Microbacterium sp. T2.11-28]